MEWGQKIETQQLTRAHSIEAQAAILIQFHGKWCLECVDSQSQLSITAAAGALTTTATFAKICL